MPRSPRKPPRAPLDRATLEAALSGDDHARQVLVFAVGTVVDRVLVTRPQPEAKRLSLGVWRHLLDDCFAVLREWDPESGSFEQHVADAVLTWLDDATSRGSAAIAWTPALVSTALDVGGELQEQLARDVLDILRRTAHQLLRSRSRERDGAMTAEDLSQEFATKVFENGGSILRGWDPDRRRKTLRSYLSFIGRRHFNQMMRKNDKVAETHQRSQEIAAPQPELAAQLLRALVLEAVRAQLDQAELELLEQVCLGVSGAEGAAAFGITPNTYSQRKFRLSKRLEDIMKALDGREG